MKKIPPARATENPMLRLLLPFSSLFLAALLSAQTRAVLPAAFAQQEGESFTSIPFGRSSSVHVQHYYEGRLFAGKGTLIAVGFRPDGGKSFAKKGVELEIRCSSSAKRATGLSRFFVSNLNQDLATVFKRRILNLPIVASSPGPRTFSLRFFFDSPFVYDPKKGGLLIDLRIYGQARGRYDLDLGALGTSRQLSFGKPGCAGSNSKVPRLDVPTSAVLWGKPFVFRVRDLSPKQVLGLMLGTQEASWGSVPLPLDLGPAGAHGCYLNTDPFLLTASVADAKGEARLQGVIPPDPAFLGYWVRSQAFTLDSKANRLGLTTTAGNKVQVCGPFPVARLVGGTVGAFTGTLEQGRVPVTELSWK
ncbi:MAG: hypothetical protein CSA62_03380 [Planctomycetota bacterium]|nr:MAG: hypothetical protein CSA62_03380 [Planctomycetota bacterium]